MPLLQNHIAVVTGAGSGIGRAIANGYAREGARVVLLDMNEKAAADARKKSATPAARRRAFLLDVTKRDDCVAMAKQIAEKIGQVSSWSTMPASPAATACWARPKPSSTIGKTSSRSTSPASSTSPMRSSNRCAPAKGRIVNIGSIQSFVHLRTPSSPAYTASKHGVLGFTKALAAELGKDGVRVNAIGPGFIETPLNEKVRATNPALVKVFVDHTPLGRAGTAEDIVGPAIFLASDMSAYVSDRS